MKPSRPALAALSVALLLRPGAAEIIERVVAKVNGDIVTLSEFEARQIAALQAARVTPERVESYLRDNNARILQEAIDELLMLQRAAELGIKLRPEYVADVIEGIKKENNIASDEAFQEQLRREGMSLDDLRRNITRSVLRRQVLARELESKLAVTEAEARADYEQRKADYTRPATVRLQEILVRADTPGAAELARSLTARARGGEDFATLARTHSAAPSRAAGGDLGVLAQGDLNPQLEQVAFGLAPGTVSDPVAVPEGYRILRVAEKTPGSVIAFEDARAEILKQLSQQRSSDEYDKYVAGLRKSAVIDVRVREVPLQVELPPAPDAAAPKAEAAPGPDAPEFSVSPQTRPDRVTSSPAPGEAPRPAPTPSPSPR